MPAPYLVSEPTKQQLGQLIEDRRVDAGAAGGTWAVRQVAGFSGFRSNFNTASVGAGFLPAAVSLGSALFDTGGYFSGGTPTRMTAPSAGYYLIGGHAFAAVAAGKGARIEILRNGVTFLSGTAAVSDAIGVVLETSSIFNLISGDYCEVMVDQHDTGAVNVTVGGWMTRLG